MVSKREQLKWQAEDDASTMARYQEIMEDKARARRAIAAANERANDMQKRAKAMSRVAGIKVPKTSNRKK